MLTKGSIIYMIGLNDKHYVDIEELIVDRVEHQTRSGRSGIAINNKDFYVLSHPPLLSQWLGFKGRRISCKPLNWKGAYYPNKTVTSTQISLDGERGHFFFTRSHAIQRLKHEANRRLKIAEKQMSDVADMFARIDALPPPY